MAQNPDAALERWSRRLAAELGLDTEADVPLLLEIAREAAHAVGRTAAPVSTFLVGVAAARAGGSSADVEAAAAVVRRLAAEWDLGLQQD